MTFNNWLLDFDEWVVSLSLNRSDQNNLLNSDTLFELGQICSVIEENQSIRVVILQGQGKHFSAGMDPEIIKNRLALSLQSNRDFILQQQRCLDRFESLSKMTIAKLRGFCYGGGLILALCCDFRIASQRTVFSLPEVRLGIPILWGTQRITRIVGIAAAKELILLAKRINAASAKEYGLVHQVVAPSKLDQSVDTLAKKLVNMPLNALSTVKHIIDNSYGLPVRACEDLELDSLKLLTRSKDNQQIDIKK